MGKKGKTPKGRAGAKKKAQKGGTSDSSPWQKNTFARSSTARQMIDDDEDAYDYKGFRGFAQNNNSSPRTFTPQSSSVKLRHQTISFVAAGSTTPLEFRPKPSSEEAGFLAGQDSDDEVLDLEEAEEQDVGDSVLQTNIAAETDVEVSEGGIAQMSLNSSGEMSEQDTGPSSSDVDMEGTKEPELEVGTEQEELFVVDTAGDESLVPQTSKASGKRPARRAPPPAPSESSDEEVVFSGRGKPRTIEDPVHAPAQKTITPRRQPQKAQQPPSQPRPDPLAAWNQAARTLPQEYNNQPSTPVPRSETPREDTIKETFKKTAASQGKLGGPRTYETTEHTVYNSKGVRSADTGNRTDVSGQTDGANDEEQPHVADDLLSALIASVPPPNNDSWQSSAPEARGWGGAQSKADREVNIEATWAPAPVGSWWKKNTKQPRPDLEMSAEEKAVIDQSPPKVTKVAFAEPSSSKQVPVETNLKPTEEGELGASKTIETLTADWKQTLRNKKRAKPSMREADTIALDSPKPGPSRRSKRGARKKDNRTLRAAIESGDDDDEAGQAAYDDYMANLAAQAEGSDIGNEPESSFARSTGLGGPSMVVNGQAIGDDEVLKGPAAMMNGDDEDEWESESDGPIGQDVSDLSSDEERFNYDDISGSSDLEDALETEEREMWEDEEDLRERRQQAKTDEQLAHLLAKQQEFGYADDDLVLDDGVCMDGIGDLDDARTGLANMTNIVNGTRKTKSARRSGGRKDFNFPNASALADSVDQYGDAGFDVMDFERPSLRPTKKGRKGKLPAELEALSDDEMKENVSTAWENDREKKRLKKVEREELRAQGMLGATGKKGKADLTEKYKYQDGMNQTQIIDELRVFLKDDGQQSRPFPPMDAHNRKRLHEIAHHLGLKSKSVGAGKSRLPVLYKTSQTLEYDERLFSETMRSNRETMSLNVKFAKRAKRMAGKGRGGGAGGGRGGGGLAAASVGHGEIVGANAPEIGVENKGFKFMQKMGWTPGMSLGREGEGRLRPVEQMMRVGRAGLG